MKFNSGALRVEIFQIPSRFALVTHVTTFNYLIKSGIAAVLFFQRYRRQCMSRFTAGGLSAKIVVFFIFTKQPTRIDLLKVINVTFIYKIIDISFKHKARINSENWTELQESPHYNCVMKLCFDDL